MRELEALLKLHDDDIEFDHLNNRIRCYPHIINIWSSHIIASSTRISKRFLETLKSEFAGDLVYSNIEGDEDDDDETTTTTAVCLLGKFPSLHSTKNSSTYWMTKYGPGT
jgi:hypothetical protein